RSSLNGNGVFFLMIIPNVPWIGDTLLKHLFPRLYALEVSKQVSVAEKFTVSVTGSFRRDVRGGAESHQLNLLTNLLDTDAAHLFFRCDMAKDVIFFG
nr:RNA-directed DNA polymerase, eukaryota [Tanacetum cinerariifolium]